VFIKHKSAVEGATKVCFCDSHSWGGEGNKLRKYTRQGKKEEEEGEEMEVREPRRVILNV